jgi:hypothetical protein
MAAVMVRERDRVGEALAAGSPGELWLHLVTLATRSRLRVRAQVDGPCVWVGELRLTRHGGGWLAHHEGRRGLVRVDARAALEGVFGE